jgi:hypothetical protein
VRVWDAEAARYARAPIPTSPRKRGKEHSLQVGEEHGLRGEEHGLQAGKEDRPPCLQLDAALQQAPLQ